LALGKSYPNHKTAKPPKNAPHTKSIKTTLRRRLENERFPEEFEEIFLVERFLGTTFLGFIFLDGGFLGKALDVETLPCFFFRGFLGVVLFFFVTTVLDLILYR
jgi:hypothetical protein